MTKFEEETRHWLYVFRRKKQELTLQNARQHCMLKGLTNDGLIVNK